MPRWLPYTAICGVMFVSLVWGTALFTSKNVAYKRKWFPYFVVFNQGFMILGLLMPFRHIGLDEVYLVMTAIMIALTVWAGQLQIKHTKFCDSCGGWATTNRFVTSFPGRCNGCGAEVATKPEPPDNFLE